MRLLTLTTLLALAGCAEFDEFVTADLEAPPGYVDQDRTLEVPLEDGTTVGITLPADGQYTGGDLLANTAEGVAFAVTGDDAKAAGIGALAMLGIGLATRRKKQPA